MADGEELPSNNLRNRLKSCSSGDDSDGEKPSQLGLGVKFNKKVERTGVNSNDFGASGTFCFYVFHRNCV